MPGLETIWFLLVGVLLVGYAILDGFDLGAGMLHLFVAREDRERRIVVNAVGPVWDGNEVWLLTAGGALFAAFPPVYATAFSGFYLAMMALLAALILRAVALEFRGKEDAPGWRRAWDTAFALGSFLASLLLGVAIGNVLRGVPLDPSGEFAGSFLGLLNPFALLVGLLTVAMFLVHGAAWLDMKTENAVRGRVRRAGRRAFLAYLAAWLAVTLSSRSSAPRLWAVYEHTAASWLAPVVFLASIVTLRWATARGRPALAFTSSSFSIAALIGIMGQGLYPWLLPALGEAGGGLTVFNAASSPLTLKTMLVIALLGIPLVVAYTVFIYRVFRGPVVLDDVSY